MRYKTKKKMQYLQETKNLIKDAIIEKGQPVSDTDTFRSYVDKIKALGGGSSDGGQDSYKYFEGSFTATSSTMTVTHECGEVPDFLLVYYKGIPATGKVFFSTGYSQAMLDKTDDLVCRHCVVFANGTFAHLGSSVGIDKSGHPEIYVTYGGIRNVTDTQFTIGCNDVSGGLITTTDENTYYYQAICGLA